MWISSVTIRTGITSRDAAWMRLLRGSVPLVLDGYDYRFELGKAKLLRDGDDVLVIASGFMTMRALEVAQALAADKVGVAVLHCPTIKPLAPGPRYACRIGPLRVRSATRSLPCSARTRNRSSRRT
jgi:transketolase C-terminal domain/subunit